MPACPSKTFDQLAPGAIEGLASTMRGIVIACGRVVGVRERHRVAPLDRQRRGLRPGLAQGDRRRRRQGEPGREDAGQRERGERFRRKSVSIASQIHRRHYKLLTVRESATSGAGLGAVTVLSTGRTNAHRAYTQAGMAPPALTVIGLDAATFDVIDPLVEAGELPHIARILREGTGGVMRSTTHPLTPHAWTTMVTGVNAARHGVWDFIERAESGYDLRMINGSYRRAPAIWDHLQRSGRRVGIVNIPFTWPAPSVDGFVLAGMDAAGREKGMTFPAGLVDELHERFGQLELDHRFPVTKEGDADLDFVRRAAEQKVKVSLWLAERFEPELLWVVFMAPDHIHHVAWPDWDERRGDSVVAETYRIMDESVGKLVEARRRQRRRPRLRPRRRLAGGRRQPERVARTRGVPQLHRPQLRPRPEARGRADRPAPAHPEGASLQGQAARRRSAGADVRTGAVLGRRLAAHPGIRLRGVRERRRQRPRARARRRRRARRGVRPRARRDHGQGARAGGAERRADRRRRAPPRGSVRRAGARQGARPPDRVPDYEFLGKGNFSARSDSIWDTIELEPGSAHEYVGSHRHEGIFALAGPSATNGERSAIGIEDVAPTVLYLLGEKIPAELEGRLVAEAIDPDLLDRRPPDYDDTAPFAFDQSEEGYAPEEAEEVARRLRGLGYIE